jgi:DNA repair protein RecN (Recombination protein N)
MPKAQLLELSAKNLGVIESATLEFAEGFNVLTGETGAGKTLLLGALSLCLGQDSLSSRYAVAADTVTSAVFLDREGREVALGRESSPSGRLRSVVNGSSSSAEGLRTIADDVIAIHGQHDSLALKNRSEILRLIDGYHAIDTSHLTALRGRIRELESLLAENGGSEEARARQKDFLTFQIAELESAKIVAPTELEDVLEELTALTRLRDGQVAIHQAIEAFSGDQEGAVLSAFAQAVSAIPQEPAFEAVRYSLHEALSLASDAVRDLGALADPELVNAERFAALEARAAVLSAVARKYGGSVASAFQQLQAFILELESLGSSAESLKVAAEEHATAVEEENRESSEVREKREAAGRALGTAISGQLIRVALPHARVEFIAGGRDGSEAEILFSPNPGQPSGPIQALASGGELSRVLLAICLETAQDGVVAVFDEVDAGIGGQVAQQIGDCLAELGNSQQVLAVTHLAAVAARANHHFLISKEVVEGRTTTTVSTVVGEARVDEIARMLSGEITDESRALARKLLDTPQ